MSLTGNLYAAALAHERDPAQDKCTMLNPNANRHLRGATGAQQPHSSLPTERLAPAQLMSAFQAPPWGQKRDPSKLTGAGDITGSNASDPLVSNRFKAHVMYNFGL